MTAQAFQRYLEHPTALYELPLQTLRELADAHPYAPNLRLLLALKTHLEGHPTAPEYLARAAAASCDRSALYDLLRELERTPLTEETDVLELKTLDDLALEDAALAANPATSAHELPDLRYEDIFPAGYADATGEEYDGGATDAPAEIPLPTEPANTLIVPAVPTRPPTPPVDLDGWSAAAGDFLTVLPAFPAPRPAEAPQPAPADLPLAPEPVSRFQPPIATAGQLSLRDRLRSIRHHQTTKLADEQEEVRKIARRSLVSSEGTASETLARLLVQQGQYQNAIKMYRRLELLYPEKKTIFAGLIKDLQEKL